MNTFQAVLGVASKVAIGFMVSVVLFIAMTMLVRLLTRGSRRAKVAQRLDARRARIVSAADIEWLDKVGPNDDTGLPDALNDFDHAPRDVHPSSGWQR